VNDINTFENPSNIRVQPFSGAKKQGTDLLVALPPKSIVMLELK
jgi:alpha-N-arabinofuranosidase